MKSKPKGIAMSVKSDKCQMMKESSIQVKPLGMPTSEARAFLMRQVISSLPERLQDDDNLINAAITMLMGIDPKDELEGMLAAQMVAVHITSMNMSSQSMAKGQPREGINSYVNNMTKLMRTFTTQLETLQKYRGKCNQTIQVQHVQVNDNAQAIVGDVQGGGSDG